MISFRAACVQLCSSDDMEDNIRVVVELIREAKASGAEFVATPENTTLMARDGGARAEKSYREDIDPALHQFRSVCEELGIWLLIGSLAIRVSDDKTANRSFLFDPSGRIAARYDKIFLFDVDLPNGESYRESNTVAAGDIAVTADLPWGRLGLSICYDLRFPQLYRRLAQAGSSFLAVPSAFTETTGKAHWHTLLRARAIENGAFVIAPAQGGAHANGRRTYGHSLIVSPSGEILAEADTDPCVITAMIDTDQVNTVRGRIPSLRRDKEFSGP